MAIGSSLNIVNVTKRSAFSGLIEAFQDAETTRIQRVISHRRTHTCIHVYVCVCVRLCTQGGLTLASFPRARTKLLQRHRRVLDGG